MISINEDDQDKSDEIHDVDDDWHDVAKNVDSSKQNGDNCINNYDMYNIIASLWIGNGDPGIYNGTHRYSVLMHNECNGKARDRY